MATSSFDNPLFDKQYLAICYKALKKQTMAAYGGCCYCCGEKRLKFLTLDHAWRDGAAARKAGSSGGATFYKALHRKSFPQNLGLRVACYNCNCGARTSGICPYFGRH